MKLKEIRAKDWRVLALCNDRGDCELLDFLHGLEQRFRKDADRLLALLERVAEHGPTQLSDEVSHQLNGDVWEFLQGRLRVLWFYSKGRIVVCSHGIVKKTRKVPPSDIKLAQRRCNEFKKSALEVVADEEEGA